MVGIVPRHMSIATFRRSLQDVLEIYSRHSHHTAQTDMEDVEESKAHRPQEQGVPTYETRIATQYGVKHHHSCI